MLRNSHEKDIDGYYEEAGIDDEGNAHGKFIINSATGKIQGDFLHGTCNNFRYINLQTGDTENGLLRISALFLRHGYIMMNILCTHYII